MASNFALALLDVDGTLRDAEGWKAHAPQLLERLAAAGLRVALCSGRNTESLKGLASARPQIEFIAAGSGSLVLARDGEDWQTLETRFLPTDTVEWVRAQAEAVGMELWAYTNTEWLVESYNERVNFEASMVGSRPVVQSFAGRDDVVKILAFPLSRMHRAVLDTIDAQRDLAVVQSYPGYFDVVRAESVAAKGGDVLIEHLGIDWSQVIAAGDGENDLGMLSRAGAAMAMAPMRTMLLDPPQPGQHRFNCPDLVAVMNHLTDLGVLS